MKALTKKEVTATTVSVTMDCRVALRLSDGAGPS